MVVVGSGPGGAIAARKLASEGKRVIVVEAGKLTPREELPTDSGELLAKYFWDGGLRTTRGNVFLPTLQAKCVGGGSLVNSAICMRPPEWVYDRWRNEHGVDADEASMLADFEEVEAFMHVTTTPPEIMGKRNELFRQACESLGWSWEATARNVVDCKGSSECFYGCRNGAKQSTDRRGIPEVLNDGGTVYSGVQIEKLIMSGRRCRGVIGRVVDPDTGKRGAEVRITAKRTVLAAGAIATPVICQASGLRREPIGANLRFHPGSIVVGTYDEDIVPWAGATQGYHCNDFLDQGIKLESIWVSTALIAFRMPGLAAEFKDHAAKYRKMAPWDAWVSGEESSGRVRHIPRARPDLTYELKQGDVRRLQEATAKLSEMQFAAGANEVLTGLGGHLAVLNSPDQANALRREALGPEDFPTASNHVYGTMAMGADERTHATDSNGAVYETEGLYVADTSLFPGSPAVNPMLPVMAFANRIARTILTDL